MKRRGSYASGKKEEGDLKGKGEIEQETDGWMDGWR